MGARIRLLGPPAVQRDGRQVTPTGRKAWGLQCYALLRRAVRDRIIIDPCVGILLSKEPDIAKTVDLPCPAPARAP